MAYSWRTVTDYYIAIACSIAILLSGLQVGFGAPTVEEEWWLNPCNKLPPIRHSRSAAESQLKRFLLEMGEKFYKEIKDMYKPMDTRDFKGNCPRINNLLKPIQNAQSVTSATQAFYETLLQFAKFINRLKNIPVVTKGEFDNARRQRVFEEAKSNLRLLICEYNDTLSNRNHRKNQQQEVFSQQPRKSVKINMKCLPDIMDNTRAHFLDVDFFRKLEKFLKQSRRIIKRKKNAGKRPGGNKTNKRTKKMRNHKFHAI